MTLVVDFGIASEQENALDMRRDEGRGSMSLVLGNYCEQELLTI
jgi:hypothetical protein